MKQITLRLICFILLITQLPVFNLAQIQTDSNAPQDETKLELENVVEREIKSGEDHIYTIKLVPGQYAITIDRHNVDRYNVGLTVTLFTPDGRDPRIVNYPPDAPKPIIYSMSVRAFSNFRISVRVSDTQAMVGRYSIKVVSQAAGVPAQYVRIKNFANALVTAKTEIERKALLSNEKDLITVRLLYELYDHSRNFLIQQEYKQSLLICRLAVELAEQIGDKAEHSYALYHFGQTLSYQGDHEQALEYLKKSLALSANLIQNKSARTHWNIATRLQFIGNIYNRLNNTARASEYYDKALENFEKVLKLHEELQNKSGIADVLNVIGGVYNIQGNQSKALEYFQKALKLFEELDNKNNIPNTLISIGSIHERSSNFTLAMEYYQKSLTVSEVGGNKSVVMSALERMGSLTKLQGKYAAAMKYYQEYLKLSELIGHKVGQVAALWHIADIYYRQGQYEKALEFSERTTLLAKQIGRLSHIWMGKLTTGKSYRELKQLDKARQALEESISTVETIRSNIAGEEERAKYFSQVQQPYEVYIDLLMQKHKEQPSAGSDVLAFEASERARARSLLDLLNEANTDIRQGVDPQLLNEERSLQQQLNARAEQQTRLLSRRHTPEQAAALKKDIDALSFEYRNNQAQIRLKSPRYAALTQPQPLKLSEIQKAVLDTDTIILEYALGVEGSYLWVVTSDSLKSYELPKRSEIESDVRRVVGLLNDGKRWATDEKINTEYVEAAVPLSRKLLPSSVLPQLKGKRLAIVSDGALQYLPFGALPLLKEPKTENKTPKTDAVPLAVEYEIVSLPSASALAVLRRETANRKPAAKTIAIFADPVFSETDERVATAKANQSKVNQPARIDLNRLLLERAFNWNGESNEPLSIARLPFTRIEADGIFTTASSKSSLKALNFEANRDNVMKRNLSDYRIIHLATHGLLNSIHPELSGIVLSLVNEQGQAVDGFLRLNEIYNLNLSADLVVLSACQTALGKEIRGEGLIGLTRGFMYAGSPRVVASLWKVDDAATAELMKIFYQKMLKEKMRPAAALRAAKIEVRNQKRWNAPFYWAAFELQGEWR